MKPSSVFLRELIKLAIPITVSQVGYVLVGMADTFFMGRMGIVPLAIGTLSIQYHVIFLVLTMGISYALSPLILDILSNHHSAGEVCGYFHHTLRISLWVSLVMIPLSVLLFPLFCFLFDVDKDIIWPSFTFVCILSFSLIPLSVFTTCRMLFESYGDSATGMNISIRGNLLNIMLNILFIYGLFKNSDWKYYAPAFATLIARGWMAFSFMNKVRIHSVFHSFYPLVWSKFRMEREKSRKILQIGIPVSLQFFFEVVAFTAAGFLAAGFGKIQIDAHGIALQLASLTYMFGSGISNAACVLSGKYQSDKNMRLLSFYVPIRLILLITFGFSLLFIAFHRYLPYFFTGHEEVVHYSSMLILLAALFQMADGTQVVCAGILRGIQDVRFPTRVIAVSYMVVGIGGAYLLGIVFDLQVRGIWIALSVALGIVATMLFLRCYMLFVLRGKSGKENIQEHHYAEARHGAEG